jgi:nucleoside-diphosphate-sugar epimerase
MRCLFLTGATGVIGRAVVKTARAHRFRVRALARSSASASAIEALGAEPVLGDLFSPEGLTTAVSGSSAILHLATRIPLVGRWRERTAWKENDRIRRDGTRNLVDAALASGVETFIYPSVTLVYPDRGSNWIEGARTPVQRADLTNSTLDAEHAVARFASARRRGIILRMGPFYGPQSQQSRYILDLAGRGFFPFIACDAAYHPFIWIEDAGDAVISALEAGLSGTYDIVDDEPLTIAEIRTVLAQAVGRRRLWRVPSPVLRYTMGSSLAALSQCSRRVSNAAYKAASGWAPTVPSAKTGWQRIASGRLVPTGA